MSAPVFSTSDYAQAISNLLPKGRAWPRDPDTNLMKLMGALAPTYQRSGAAAANLIADVFPATTTSFIPEWEETLGLPDPCSPLNPTTEQRRAAILAKFIGSGGQSVAYYISVAAALGYTITITQFAPFRVGINTVGQPLYGPAWAQAWQVNGVVNPATYFKAGQSSAGDPLVVWGNTILECRLNQIKPAHTVLIFNYT